MGAAAAEGTADHPAMRVAKVRIRLRLQVRVGPTITQRESPRLATSSLRLPAPVGRSWPLAVPLAGVGEPSWIRHVTCGAGVVERAGEHAMGDDGCEHIASTG